jgi:hypothetical protein
MLIKLFPGDSGLLTIAKGEDPRRTSKRMTFPGNGKPGENISLRV